jgi:putative hydrolase of the HAD superfamily
MSIDAVIFDFGNVLGFFSHQKAIRQLLAYAPPGASAEAMLAFALEIEHRFELGELSGREVVAMLRAKFGLKGGDAELSHALADMFTPNPPVCELVPRLQGRYRLGLLSNTNEVHYALFRRQFAAVLDRFDHLIVSHEARLRKPDPALFLYTQARFGLPAERMVFIDDLPANVEAARRCGWQGVVYTSPEALVAHLEEMGVTLAG